MVGPFLELGVQEKFKALRNSTTFLVSQARSDHPNVAYPQLLSAFAVIAEKEQSDERRFFGFIRKMC
jgi:hypothetical protein